MTIKIRFTEEALPAVKSGKTMLHIRFDGQSETEMLGESEEKIPLIFERKRFTVESQEVYSVYPPKQSRGDYRNHLPHIVFNRASVPWEFAEDGSPSIALFLLREGEGAVCKEMETGSVCEAEDGVFIADRLRMTEKDADKPEDVCKIVDIPVKQFRKLWLDKKQRKLLSHVREVSLEDKVTDPEVRNGIFSVVLSHRFPEEGQNHVFAVSLAEYEGVCIPEEYRFVRCICYFHWEFSSEEKQYDFLEEMKKLKVGTLTRPVSARVADTELQNLLKRGFLPMNHNLREGSKTVSWYRGPWIPYEEILEEPRYHVFADELYYYDTQAGMLDISYAAAWQLGRMAAMHHPSMAGELISWRLQDYQKAAVGKQKEELKEALHSETEDTEALLKKLAHKIAVEVPDYEEKENGR